MLFISCKKALLAGLLAVSSLTALAFSQEECAWAAESVYSAQQFLNTNPAEFPKVHAAVKAMPASNFGVSEALKKYMELFVDNLKPGMDPNFIGMAVFNGCKTQKTT